jgi:hypothetical protein
VTELGHLLVLLLLERAEVVLLAYFLLLVLDL